MVKDDAPPSWTGKSIRRLSLHRRRANPLNLGYGLEHVPFVLLYAYALYHCFLTIGEPYAQAIKELEEAGILMPGLDAAADASADALSGLAASALSQGVVRDDLSSRINYTELLAQDEDGPPLPNPFLPAIVPLLYLLGTTVSHMLMVLLQIWSVKVLSLIKYAPVRSFKDATYVLVVPRSFKGKSSIVPLEKGKNGQSFFLFQKHKYIAEIDEEGKGVVFTKLKAPTSHHDQNIRHVAGHDDCGRSRAELGAAWQE